MTPIFRARDKFMFFSISRNVNIVINVVEYFSESREYKLGFLEKMGREFLMFLVLLVSLDCSFQEK